MVDRESERRQSYWDFLDALLSQRGIINIRHVIYYLPDWENASVFDKKKKTITYMYYIDSRLQCSSFSLFFFIDSSSSFGGIYTKYIDV